MIDAEVLPKWTTEAARGLAETLGEDHDRIASQVDVGIAQLWRIDAGTSWMVTRIEHTELVVCCYKGKNLVDVARILKQAAKRQRLKTVRIHTRRPGLARLLQEFGFEQQETVFRATL